MNLHSKVSHAKILKAKLCSIIANTLVKGIELRMILAWISMYVYMSHIGKQLLVHRMHVLIIYECDIPYLLIATCIVCVHIGGK